jgi:Fatty acid hydroxylase superfamily
MALAQSCAMVCPSRVGVLAKTLCWVAVAVSPCIAFAPVSQRTCLASTRGVQQACITTSLLLRATITTTTALNDDLVNTVDTVVPSQQQQVSHPSTSNKREAVPTTMREAVTTFLIGDSYNGPRAVVVVLAGLFVWRVWLSISWHATTAAVGLSDAIVVSAAVVFWWLQEHWMHKYLLHSSQDWYGKQVHEQHHIKPYHHVSIDPAPLMLGWMMAVHIVLRATLPLPLAISATIGYAAAGLFYEWSHFIVHTKVRFPGGSFWQRMKDHHIRHHLVDSDYWLAFSVTQVDDIFGTNPNVKDVQLRKKLKNAATD